MQPDYTHELVLPNEDLPFKLFLFEGKDGNYQRAKHWHRSVEIFLVLEGELEFFINSTPLPLCAIDFVIVNPNEIHSIKAPRPNTTIVVQIPLFYFSDYLRKEDYAVFSKQSEEENLRLAQIIVQIYRCYQKKNLPMRLKCARCSMNFYTC